MRIFLLVAGLFLSVQSYADESFRHEFYLGSLTSPQATAILTSGGQNYTFGAGYNYRLDSLRDWQIGVDGIVGYSSYSGGSYTSVGLLVGPTYNFSNQKGEIANAFFLFFHFGLAYVSTSYSDSYSTYSQSYTVSDGMWELGAGKRFQLTESVSYRPGVVVSMTAPSPDPVWTIIPFSFGINL